MVASYVVATDLPYRGFESRKAQDIKVHILYIGKKDKDEDEEMMHHCLLLAINLNYLL